MCVCEEGGKGEGLAIFSLVRPFPFSQKVAILSIRRGALSLFRGDARRTILCLLLERQRTTIKGGEACLRQLLLLLLQGWL